MIPDETKGMGSAYGGEWQPKKSEDERFLGKPGEVKESISGNGYARKTKIGMDGRAEKERHYSNHNNPKHHTKPHDHSVDWSKGYPRLGNPINYPDGAPEFKAYKEVNIMQERIVSFDGLAFESLAEFKWCVVNGGEVMFIWKGRCYTITHPDGLIDIGEAYYLKDGKAYNVLSHAECDADDRLTSKDIGVILDYMIEGDRLGDIVTKIGIVDRTL